MRCAHEEECRTMNHPDPDRLPSCLRRLTGDRNDWLSRVQEAIERSAPIPVDGRQGDVFGWTFQIAVGLDLAERIPYPHLLAAMPAPEAAWTAQQAGYQARTGIPYCEWPRTGQTPPRSLHAAASNLAQIRPVRDTSGWTEEQVRRLVGSTGFVRARRLITAKQLPTFEACWHAHVNGPQQVLRQLGPVRGADIPFHDGYQVADLIVGTSLVEIKTGDDEDAKLGRTLRRSMACALLADGAGYTFDEVAVYLARHRLVIRSSLHACPATQSQSSTQGRHTPRGHCYHGYRQRRSERLLDADASCPRRATSPKAARASGDALEHVRAVDAWLQYAIQSSYLVPRLR
jgi:hypothetical protein